MGNQEYGTGLVTSYKQLVSDQLGVMGLPGKPEGIDGAEVDLDFKTVWRCI
jgi:hypothetical protein